MKRRLKNCSLPEGAYSSLHFGQTGLVGLEEKSVHVGQFYFVVIEENELETKQRDENNFDEFETWGCLEQYLNQSK